MEAFPFSLWAKTPICRISVCSIRYKYYSVKDGWVGAIEYLLNEWGQRKDGIEHQMVSYYNPSNPVADLKSAAQTSGYDLSAQGCKVL